MDLSWMAWTNETAIFFAIIGGLLMVMSVIEIIKPGGARRRGIVGLVTTRGDRLFISLLSSSYIHMAWLAFTDAPLYFATVVSLIFAACVFKWF